MFGQLNEADQKYFDELMAMYDDNEEKLLKEVENPEERKKRLREMFSFMATMLMKSKRDLDEIERLETMLGEDG